MRNYIFLTIVGLLSLKICFAEGKATPDDSIRAMLANSGNVNEAKEEIDKIVKEGKGNLLAAAMNNPNWDVRIAAIKAISSLSKSESKGVLNSILENTLLWKGPIKSGEGKVVQENFLSDLQKVIKEKFGINASSMDLFQPEQRARLISSISTA